MYKFLKQATEHKNLYNAIPDIWIFSLWLLSKWADKRQFISGLQGVGMIVK